MDFLQNIGTELEKNKTVHLEVARRSRKIFSADNSTMISAQTIS